MVIIIRKAMNLIKKFIFSGLVLGCGFTGYSQSFKNLDSIILHCIIDYASSHQLSVVSGSEDSEGDDHSRKKHGRFNNKPLSFNLTDKNDEGWDETTSNVWLLHLNGLPLHFDLFRSQYDDTLSKHNVYYFDLSIYDRMGKKLKKGLPAMSLYVKVEGNSLIITIEPSIVFWTRPFISIAKLSDGRRRLNILQGETLSIPFTGQESIIRFRYSPESDDWILLK